VALISVGVLGFAMNTGGVIRGNYLSGNLTVATNLAQDKIEEIRTRKVLTDVFNCPDSSEGADPAEPNIDPVGSSGGIYNRCWNIQDSPLGAGLKLIQVTVFWRDYLKRSVTLSTLAYRG
jgi:hypothetical protein